MPDIAQRVSRVSDILTEYNDKLFIAYSGGKDSSAVVKIICEALQSAKAPDLDIELVYCDTGVENPIVDRFVHSCIKGMNDEFASKKLPIKCTVLVPEVHQSYLVRVIGRGYPPPTNSFRWCTKDTRIRPVKKFIDSIQGQRTIAVGTRMGESQQRDRSLAKSFDFDQEIPLFQKQRDGFSEATLFTPIIDFDVDDVWETLVELDSPTSIPVHDLAKLYKDGGGECPTMRDFKDKPCSRARFGCWTCTVVRKDKSAIKMIEQGHLELEPYLGFRDWLIEIRNLPEYRCKKRRNGRDGPGPFNLYARKVILERLRQLELTVGSSLLSSLQAETIEALWAKDRADPDYALIE